MINPYLRLFHDLCDPPPALEVLPEQLLAAQVAAPHAVDAHGGVDLVEEPPQHVLVTVVCVHHLGHLLEHSEEHLLRGAGQLQQLLVAEQHGHDAGDVVEASDVAQRVNEVQLQEGVSEGVEARHLLGRLDRDPAVRLEEAVGRRGLVAGGGGGGGRARAGKAADGVARWGLPRLEGRQSDREALK